MIRRIVKYIKAKNEEHSEYNGISDFAINVIIAHTGALFISHNKKFGSLFILLCVLLALDNILEGRGKLASKVTIILYVICLGFILFSTWSSHIG